MEIFKVGGLRIFRIVICMKNCGVYDGLWVDNLEGLFNWKVWEDMGIIINLIMESIEGV